LRFSCMRTNQKVAARNTIAPMSPGYHEIRPSHLCGVCKGTGRRLRHGRLKPRCVEPEAIVCGRGRRQGRFWIFGDCTSCVDGNLTRELQTDLLDVWVEEAKFVFPEPVKTPIRGAIFSSSGAKDPRAVIEGDDVFSFAAEGELGALDIQAAAE